MKILVGFDESNISEEAVKTAVKHAQEFNAEVEVVTAISRGGEMPYESIVGLEKKLAKEVLNLIHGLSIRCETNLLLSNMNSADQLVEYAKLKNFDEIIIGAKQRSKFGKFVFGSTTQNVILNAPCPVVSVK